MKAEYLALVQFEKDKDKGTWINALLYSGNKRVAGTREEAVKALEIVKQKFDGKAKTETDYSMRFGVSTVIDEDSAKALSIVGMKIKKRMVTEWEEETYK